MINTARDAYEYITGSFSSEDLGALCQCNLCFGPSSDEEGDEASGAAEEASGATEEASGAAEEASGAAEEASGAAEEASGAADVTQSITGADDGRDGADSKEHTYEPFGSDVEGGENSDAVESKSSVSEGHSESSDNGGDGGKREGGYEPICKFSCCTPGSKLDPSNCFSISYVQVRCRFCSAPFDLLFIYFLIFLLCVWVCQVSLQEALFDLLEYDSVHFRLWEKLLCTLH